VFDYAISIATIHHLSTHERRRSAVKRLLESVSRDHGRILIYVWAIEQDELSKRQVIPEGDIPPLTGKDVVVPWVLSKEPGAAVKSHADTAAQEPQVYNRYYHMFAKGELSRLVVEAAAELALQVGSNPRDMAKNIRGVEIVQDGWERSNYYVELQLW